MPTDTFLEYILHDYTMLNDQLIIGQESEYGIQDFSCIASFDYLIDGNTSLNSLMQIGQGKEVYGITITWTDISTYEDSYRIGYSIDGQSYQFIDILTATKLTTDSVYMYYLKIPYMYINENIRIKIASINQYSSENFTAPITLVKPSSLIQGYYDESTSMAKFAWKDDLLLENKYRLFYRIDSGAEIEIDKDTIVGESGSIISHEVAMSVNSILHMRIYPVIDSLVGLPSFGMYVGKIYNTEIITPTVFDVNSTEDGIIEYTWVDNTDGEAGYQLVYTINDWIEQIIDVPSTTMNSQGHVYAVTILVQNLDKIKAHVRAYTLVNNSDWTDYKGLTFYSFDPLTPSNYMRTKIPNGVRLSWNSVEYIDHYEITYYINGVESKINTTDCFADVNIDYATTVSFSAYMIAYYLGDLIAPVTETIVFTPIYLLNDQYTLIYTHEEKAYLNNQITYQVNQTVEYRSFVKILSLGTRSQAYPITTSVTTKGTFSSSYLQSRTITTFSKNIPFIEKIINVASSSFEYEERNCMRGLVFDFVDCVASFQKDMMNSSVNPVMLISNNVSSDVKLTTCIVNREIDLSATPLVTTSYFINENYNQLQSIIHTKISVPEPTEADITYSFLESTIAVYLDKTCTIEENVIVLPDTTESYNVVFNNMYRGRTKNYIRYIKNLGTQFVSVSVETITQNGLDIHYSTNGITYNDNFVGIIPPMDVVQLNMKINVPESDDEPELSMNITARSIEST